jgi:ABC-2 type transport system permease protein
MWTRIGALVLRHLYLYRRSTTRLGEIFFWPVMELLLWGFLTTYLQRMQVPNAVLFLIGAVIFWDVLYRSQQAVTISITEEIWVRNILNLFIAPVRISEILIATCLVGVLKALAIAAILGVLAWIFYAFNLLVLGPALVPFLVSLLLFGWAVGMCTMGLIRWMSCRVGSRSWPGRSPRPTSSKACAQC